MERIRAFDMFCGAGGASLGAREAGAEIVGGVDLWGAAVSSFRVNFPDAKVFHKDLRELTPEEVKKAVGDIDLLISSPECTHHTCARGNKPRSDESKDTAFQVTRYAKVLRPRWITLENVINMKPWSRYNELKEEIESLGYTVREQVIDSSLYGVPQRRRRLFMIAELNDSPPIIAPEGIERRDVRTILAPEGTYKMSPLYSARRAIGTIERAERAFAKIGTTTPFLIVYYGTDGAGGWQRLDEPLRTVTTVDRFAYVVPTPNGPYMRMLQPDELRRAMGFPDNYIFPPKITRREKVKLMGNAVCSPVMKQIVLALLKKQRSKSTEEAA